MARTTTKKDAREREYIVIVNPRTDNADSVPFAKINGKIIPFDRKVKINHNDYIALKRMHEIRNRGKADIDVHQIMDDLKISQEKANVLAREAERQGMNSKPNIKKVPMYSIVVVKEL